jgi:hypothetical protein
MLQFRQRWDFRGLFTGESSLAEKQEILGIARELAEILG